MFTESWPLLLTRWRRLAKEAKEAKEADRSQSGSRKGRIKEETKVGGDGRMRRGIVAQALDGHVSGIRTLPK